MENKDFDDIFNSMNYEEEDLEQDYFDYSDNHDNYFEDDDLMSDEDYNQYIKDSINAKIESGWVGRVKERFRNFKYFGTRNDDTPIQEKSLDDRKKIFFIIVGVTTILLIIAISVLFK